MVKLLLQRNERNQKVLIVTVCTMICFAPISYFVNQFCRLIFGVGFTLDTLVCYAALALMILASLKQLHFQIRIDVLLVLILFILAYAMSYSFGESNKLYMFTRWDDFAGNPAYLLFVYSLPAYVFMRYITDYERMFEICCVFSLIVVFSSLGSLILMLLRDNQPEYMNFSYNLIFGTIFSWIYFFERKKTLSLVAAIIGVVMIFIVGARGPLVCFLFSMLAYFLMSKASTAKKVFLVFFLLTVGLIVMVLWQPMLQALKETVDAIGISSRTIDILLSGQFTSDSGRGDIQLKIIEEFTLFGRGLYGDRTVGTKRFAHNLVIELISQWGFLFGTLIVVVLGVLFIKGFRTKNSSLRLLILALFSSSVVKLMLSGSYLEHNPALFAVIAACVNSLNVKETLPSGEDAEPQKRKSKYIKIPGRYN